MAGQDIDAPMGSTRTYLLLDGVNNDVDARMFHVPHLVQICAHEYLEIYHNFE